MRWKTASWGKPNMEYDQLVALYEDALDAILEMELQIWGLCSENIQLRQALHALNSTDPGSVH